MTTPPTLRIASDRLEDLMHEAFSRVGVDEHERRIVVNALLESSLAGYHSHGIMRVPFYVESIRNGRMVPGATMEVLRESAAAVHLDASFGLGPVAATRAIWRAVDLASRCGVGCVSVVGASDVARLGSYVIAPAEAGYVTLLLVNDAGGNPCVAAAGSPTPFLSTNPLAAGIPRGDGEPAIVIDMSTSVAASGKLKMLKAAGQPIPKDWLIDAEGNPTTEPSGALASPPTSALLPLGGLITGHKGFALSILVDVLAGALSGAGCSAGNLESGDRNGLCAIAIDPEVFTSRDQFTRSVSDYVGRLKQLDTLPGTEEVLIPGERAHRQRQVSKREGLAIEAEIWKPFADLLDALGIARPNR